MHVSRELRQRYDELGFLYAFTPVQSPEYNAAELLFSMGKHQIKKTKLDCIANGIKKPLKEIIRESFEGLET